MRWNFSSRARELSGADVIVLSIPKSGRTWLRTFLSAYFAAKSDRPFSLAVTSRRENGIPRIIYTHDRFEHRTKGSIWDRLRGKYLVPPKEVRTAQLLLLARDPRDTFASYFLQLTRRHHPAPEPIKQLPIQTLMRHPRFGIESMVAVMNSWLDEFGGRSHFTIVRYEDLVADPHANFQKVLHAIGQAQLEERAFAEALRFSSFENMQALEASGAFGDKILTPRDHDDRESFKVRRGNIGGFAEYLSKEDQEFAVEVCTRLDPRFGYAIASDRLQAEPNR